MQQLSEEQTKKYVEGLLQINDNCMEYILQQKPIVVYDQLKQYVESREKVTKKLQKIIIDKLDTAKLNPQQLKTDKIQINTVTYQNQNYLYPIDIGNYIMFLESLIAKKYNIESQINQQYFDTVVLLGTAFQSNQDLCIEILLNQKRIEDLVDPDPVDLMNAEQLYERQQYDEKLQEKRDLTRYIVKTNIECKFCHQKTVIVTEKQTRSADEATTIIYECSNCHRSWRINN